VLDVADTQSKPPVFHKTQSPKPKRSPGPRHRPTHPNLHRPSEARGENSGASSASGLANWAELEPEYESALDDEMVIGTSKRAT
jgi:hypothetical protein